MKQVFKKRLALQVIGLFLGLIALVILIRSTSTPKLYTELILNAQNNVDLTDISLFYSDVGYNQIHSYTLNNEGLSPTSTKWVPYSEGFIDRTTFDTYANHFVDAGTPLSSTFQNYYDTEDFVFFAFPGDLTTFRILQKDTGTLHPLKLPKRLYLRGMYVSHMTVVNDQLIVLAGEAMSYHALIYTIDLNTFEVTSWKRLETHPSALDEQDYTLTSDGLAVFIAGTNLQIYDPFTDTTVFQPMPFEVAGVTSDTNHLFVYSTPNQGSLSYVQMPLNTLTASSPILSSSSLIFPSPTSQVLNLSLKGEHVYFILKDSLAPRFKNYVAFYNMKTGQLDYCLGLGDASPLILTSTMQ